MRLIRKWLTDELHRKEWCNLDHAGNISETRRSPCRADMALELLQETESRNPMPAFFCPQRNDVSPGEVGSIWDR